MTVLFKYIYTQIKFDRNFCKKQFVLFPSIQFLICDKVNIDWLALFATAFLSYHNQILKSTVFQKFFKNFFVMFLSHHLSI